MTDHKPSNDEADPVKSEPPVADSQKVGSIPASLAVSALPSGGALVTQEQLSGLQEASRSRTPIVGIAASAGGLEALKQFFSTMPHDSGAAFVLVPHLDPNHESLMVELLARETSMEVSEACEGQAPQANQVYVIPPNCYLTIVDSKLHPVGPVERTGPLTSIDLFLRSLALDQRENAICIILSGTGSHGSLGLKEIKAQEGMVMAQDPETAEFSSMPQSAISTGLVDYILPPEKLPEALSKYLRHLLNSRSESVPAEPVGQLGPILDLIKNRTKFDFRCYRKPMIHRRVERRMSLLFIPEISAYYSFLKNNQGEVQRLVRDLMISVTSFFRDPEIFLALQREVVVPLVQRMDFDSQLRIWSVGCATGEEPYSLAILLLEELGRVQKNNSVHVFATDIDDFAVDYARQGRYPDSIATDVCAERLHRFFTRDGETAFRVNANLRDCITFARQNLLTDAPFSKLDLIVCRNVLIYLEPEIQEKVIALFHFSLNQGGLLFLGPSETVGPHIDLFEPLSKKWRIFRRIGHDQLNRVKFPIASIAASRTRSGRPMLGKSNRLLNLSDLARRKLLELHAPPAVVINRKCQILYFFGQLDPYLSHPEGEPTQDLFLVTREGLQTKLRSAIRSAFKLRTPETLIEVSIIHNGHAHPAIATLRPLKGPSESDDFLLITFQGSGRPAKPIEAPQTDAEESLIHQLEGELKAVREDLQNSLGEMESANEELKVTNEEAMSMNEEFQSTNEELEMSKEELQSLNEELTTANHQLQEKLVEIEAVNNDLSNLLNCTEAGILFLDRQGVIKRFTREASRLFNLIPGDIGRPIDDITPRFPNSTLRQDVEQVFHSLVRHERQIQTFDGSWWNQCITLYRTLDQRVIGTIVTYTDISEIRHSDELTRRLGSVLLDSNDAVYVHDFQGKITSWNRSAEKIYGYAEAEALFMNVEQLIPQELRGSHRESWEEMAKRDRSESWESQRKTKDGRLLDLLITATAVKDEWGVPIALAKTERDITEIKRSQLVLQKSQEQLGAVLQTAADGIITFNPKGTILSVNAATERMFGYKPFEMIGQNVEMLMPSTEQSSLGIIESFDRNDASTIGGINREVIGMRKAGSRFPVDLAVSEVDHLNLFTAILRDITERVKAEEALRESERFARSTLDGLSAHIAIICEEGKILAVNRAWRAFALSSSSLPEATQEGANYLEVSEQVDGPYQGRGKIAREGIRRVLARELPEFIMEYPWNYEELERWCIVRVTPFPGAGLNRVVIAHEDITRRKELEREVVEIASMEQRRIGQDLHDSVSQELTAINIMAGELAESFESSNSNDLALLERIVRGLSRTQNELRSVMRGLLPVAIDSQGLMAAICDLAGRSRWDNKINCTFVCPTPVSLTDNLTATHLYLIAQEAVHNAFKHSRGKNITIAIEISDRLSLSITDDGIGLSEDSSIAMGHLGIRIMQNRAAIIGATLTIKMIEPSGTQVLCRMSRESDEPI